MSTTVYPGTTSAVSFTDAPTGLVGTFGWQLLNAAGTVIQARVTTSVTETPSGSGIYRVSVTWPTTEIIVSYSRPDVPATDGPAYSTPTAVRAVLGVNSTTLPDATADALIVQAEDWIDSMLGSWYPDESTGRKILQADVLAWQWGKLTRAAALVAAALYSTPTLLTAAQYRKQAGPDFSVEDPQGGGALAPALTLLNASGLRRLTGRAVAGRRPVSRDRHFQYGD